VGQELGVLSHLGGTGGVLSRSGGTGGVLSRFGGTGGVLSRLCGTGGVIFKCSPLQVKDHGTKCGELLIGELVYQLPAILNSSPPLLVPPANLYSGSQLTFCPQGSQKSLPCAI